MRVPDTSKRPLLRKLAIIARACLRLPWALRFFVIFGAVWGAGWFGTKLVLTALSRDDAQVVNNAGRLRHVLVQYQVEFVLQTLQESRLSFIYHPAQGAEAYFGTLHNIISGLSGYEENTVENIPQAFEEVKPQLANLLRNITSFHATWQMVRGHRNFTAQEFVSRVVELTSLMTYTNTNVVEVVARVATSHANTLYWIMILSGAIGVLNTLIMMLLLHYQHGKSGDLLESTTQRFEVLSELLQMCMGSTAYVDSVDGFVLGSDEFIDLCGYTSLVRACWSEQDGNRCRLFLRSLFSSTLPNKIVLSLRSQRDSFRVECNVCGIKDGDRILLGIHVAERFHDENKSDNLSCSSIQGDFSSIVSETAAVQAEALDSQLEFPVIAHNRHFAALCGSALPERFDLLSLVVEAGAFRNLIQERIKEMSMGVKDVPQTIACGTVTLVPGAIAGHARDAHRVRTRCTLVLPSLPEKSKVYTVILYFDKLRKGHRHRSASKKDSRSVMVALPVLCSRIVELTRHLRTDTFDQSIDSLVMAFRKVVENRESYKTQWGQQCNTWVCEFCFAGNDAEDKCCAICSFDATQSPSQELASSTTTSSQFDENSAIVVPKVLL